DYRYFRARLHHEAVHGGFGAGYQPYYDFDHVRYGKRALSLSGLDHIGRKPQRFAECRGNPAPLQQYRHDDDLGAPDFKRNVDQVYRVGIWPHATSEFSRRGVGAAKAMG